MLPTVSPKRFSVMDESLKVIAVGDSSTFSALTVKALLTEFPEESNAVSVTE